VKRLWTGLKTLDRQEQGHLDPGPRHGSRADEGPRQPAGEDGTPGRAATGVLEANDVILATGSRVKSLPGLEPDGKRIVTSDDVLKRDRCRRTSSSSARRGRRRVRLDVPRPRRRR
jgi:hypothetical protein